MAWTLNGQNLGNIQGEDSQKSSQLFQMPMPGNDSTQAYLQDLFGVIRTISLKGVWAAGDTQGSINSIASFITFLDGLVNGVQSSIVYHSGKSGQSYNVLVDSVRWSSQEGDLNKLDWEINLIEGSL